MSSDIIRSVLADQLGYTADWRRQKAEEYPDDERNLEAADILERLAKEIADVEQHPAFGVLAQIADDDSALEKMTEHEQQTLKDIGFRNDIKSVDNLLAELTSVREAAA